ncbi:MULTISPECIES: DUF4350 domain-containing protein [unclassified Pseudarthrobacter]|uniref:DUF4350 domain-containing protein n=1 Tax=unclassified Pseudarthrobacter TaxID=2647000 RepID=UPI00307704AE
MTTDIDARPAVSGDATPQPVPGGLAGWGRRHRGQAVAAAVFAVALAVTIITQLAPKGDSVPLSIRNAGPDGGRAVSEILGRHGVDVAGVDSFSTALAALQAGTDSTLLLYDRNGILDESQLERLTVEATRVVLVTPRLSTLTALDAGISQAGVVPETSPTLEPGCWNDAAETAGTVSGETGFLYSVEGDGGNTVCYRPPGSEAGLLATTEDGTLSVLGSTELISNAGLDERGHSALALRTLGGSGDLVWYVPGLADVSGAGSPQTLNELAPDWVAFLGPWLVFVAALAILWRGRRFGPLVFEPLPVVVKAAETAEGRARLYHDSHAVDRARDNLRAGTLVRLAKELRLGPEASADDVVRAVAQIVDRPEGSLRELINERPLNEARLVRWSQELDNLENEVRTR